MIPKPRSHQLIHNDRQDWEIFHKSAPALQSIVYYRKVFAEIGPQTSMQFSMRTCKRYGVVLHWEMVWCAYLFVNGDKSKVHSLCTDSSTDVQCLSSKLEARFTSIVWSSHTPVVAIASCWLDMYCIMRSNTCTFQHWLDSWYHQKCSHNTTHH